MTHLTQVTLHMRPLQTQPGHRPAGGHTHHLPCLRTTLSPTVRWHTYIPLQSWLPLMQRATYQHHFFLTVSPHSLPKQGQDQPEAPAHQAHGRACRQHPIPARLVLPQARACQAPRPGTALHTSTQEDRQGSRTFPLCPQGLPRAAHAGPRVLSSLHILPRCPERLRRAAQSSSQQRSRGPRHGFAGFSKGPVGVNSF